MPVDQNLRSSPKGAAHVMERGDVFFAYRPKVEAQVARGVRRHGAPSTVDCKDKTRT